MNFVSRHPLEDHPAIVAPAGGLNRLSLPRRVAVWSVLAHRGHEASVTEALSAIDGASPRACGPQEWLVVAPAGQAERVFAALSALAGASVVDQSDGRVVFVLSGPDSRAVLSRGTGIDLHPSVFTVGQAANALVFHTGGNLARVGPQTYEIVVMRSFATWVLEEILLSGGEFGLCASMGD